jgi:hypothetical protein
MLEEFWHKPDTAAFLLGFCNQLPLLSVLLLRRQPNTLLTFPSRFLVDQALKVCRKALILGI